MLFQANGGSKELIKIMNRVGAVASNDTLQRHIESVSVYRLQKGLTHELNLNALAIVSVDNIDFLQSYAFVYSGDVSRSWHGTTIQVVQPTPPFVINNTNTHIYIYIPNDDGWTKNNNTLSVVLDSPENLESIRNCVAFLTVRPGVKN